VKKAKSKKMVCTTELITALLIMFVATPMLITVLSFHANFGSRVEMPETSFFLRHEDVEGYPRRLVNFYSGQNRLTGYIYGEDNEKGLIVIAHGLGGGAEEFFRKAMYFVDNGWRVFTFDKTGTHNSEGRGTGGIAQSAVDLEAALEYIEEQNWDIPIMLYGYSWGGYGVTAILQNGHDINAVVSLAGFASPTVMIREHLNDSLGSLGRIIYPYAWLYQQVFGGKYANLSAIDGINSGNVPVMVIHGTEDEFISYRRASIIAQRDYITNPNVVFISRYLPYHNRHNNLMVDEELAAFMQAPYAELLEMQSYHGWEAIPEDVLQDYMMKVKIRVSALDWELMDKINDFFEMTLK
jgi:pimeloyl-ACP methyl ester carboxylesterase